MTAKTVKMSNCSCDSGVVWRASLPLCLFPSTSAAKYKTNKTKKKKLWWAKFDSVGVWLQPSNLRPVSRWPLTTVLSLCEQRRSTCCQLGFLTAPAIWHLGGAAESWLWHRQHKKSLLTSINITFVFWMRLPAWLWWKHRWYGARGLCCCCCSWSSGDVNQT